LREAASEVERETSELKLEARREAYRMRREAERGWAH